MSNQLVRVTPTENLFFSLNNADPSRPYYHKVVYTYGRNIFMMLGKQDLMAQLEFMVKKEIELPMRANFMSVLDAYYLERFMMSKKAYCKVGDLLEPVIVTRYALGRKLQKITQWILDTCAMLSQNVRFYGVQQVSA
jgi:hypothetical protein